jgi:septum formation protein
VRPDLVLASASPRRRELLAQIGVRHAVIVADVDELVIAGEAPAAYVERLACAKARAVDARGGLPGAPLPVLGADTTVVIDGCILGKPDDAGDAARILRLLSGREHQVLTAVAVCRGDRLLSRVSTTRVWFRDLDDARIARYIATGEPLDKAGAYGIQGFGAALVARIDGSYTGVVGLPLAETADLLDAFGVPWGSRRDD